MKSIPKFDIPSAASSIQNADIDLLSHEQLENLDKETEKKLSKQVQQINSSIDKESSSINTIYASAIERALMQVSDYFTSIQMEESEKVHKNAQYTIQKPPQISTPSEAAERELRYSLKFTRDYQISLSKKVKEKMEDIKRKPHV
ncbi:hypothetical protein M9Y10_029066 [Tritrichomonas musculus]|uniref:Uncharacterized protein n=1 Tax=Tritrichomonas musculus TaxID=1915356 RepID=A0ABR2KL61_9EUKA